MRRLFRQKGGPKIFLSEKGAVYPLTLTVSMLAFYLFAQATFIYLAEYRFLTELRDYYDARTERLLSESSSLSGEGGLPFLYNEENGEIEFTGE